MKFRFAFALFMGVAICACRSQTMDFTKSYDEHLRQVEKMRFSVDVIESGKPISSKDDLSGGPLAVVLQKLLEEKKGAWKKSKQTSYAPRVLFTGPGMSLNVRDDLMVLNIEITKGKWQQYVSPSSPGQVREIINALGRL